MDYKRDLGCCFFLLSDPPRIKGSGTASEVTVVVNHVLELHCEASGIPTPSLTWLKDGRPLPLTDSMRLLQGGEVLRVAMAQVSGRGWFPIPHIFNHTTEIKSVSPSH